MHGTTTMRQFALLLALCCTTVRASVVSPVQPRWRHGLCTATADGWQGDCAHGALGTWPLRPGTAVYDRRSCVERCRACARCRFVSVSLENRDCSWYSDCPWEALRLDVGGADTYWTRQVRQQPSLTGRAANATACAAARPSRRHGGGRRRHGTHFVTFYSEGAPHDAGLDFSVAEGLLRAAASPFVDSYVAYTPRMVANLLVDDVPGNATVARSDSATSGNLEQSTGRNIGQSGIGHMCVKPFLILHRLLAIPKGDVLIYSDVNVLKHPALLAGLPQLPHAARQLLHTARPTFDVFMPIEGSGYKVKHFCKAHAVRELAPREQWGRIFESDSYYANKLVARNTAAARAFLREWLRASLRRELLAPLPNPEPIHKEFAWHAPEQCLYSILAALQGGKLAHAYQMSLCFSWTSPRKWIFDAGKTSDRPCDRPRARDIRSWLPALPSQHGYCLSVECPRLSPDCEWAQAALPVYRVATGTRCDSGCELQPSSPSR